MNSVLQHIRFADFELDTSGLELRRAGVRVEMQPLVMALLAYLVAHPQRLVTKDELVQAVWKGRDVSDEVIARAVMKARQALGDDARAPRHIVTETGKGFRFCCPVEHSPPDAPAPASADAGAAAAQQAAVAWRVLPFVNRSEDPALHWVATGLQSMLCHLMEQSSHGQAVGAEPADGVGEGDTGWPSGRVVRALARRPQERWVAAEVDYVGAGHRLNLAWAGPGERVASLSFEDASLPALALRAAEHLLPLKPWQRAVAGSHPQAWAQLQQTIAHLSRWPAAEAAKRLRQCFERLPPSPPLALQQAALLTEALAYDEAEAAAGRAEQLLDAEEPGNLESRLHAKVLRALVQVRKGDLALAQQRTQACLAFVDAHSQPLQAAPAMMILHSIVAYLHREAGEHELSRSFNERAAWHAMRAGLVERELFFRAIVCLDLHRVGQTHRAQDMLWQLKSRAMEMGAYRAAGLSLYVLAAIAGFHGRTREAVRWNEQALAVLLPVEDLIRSQDVRSELISDLTRLGELDRAQATLLWKRRIPDSRIIEQFTLLSLEAQLRWRQGRLDEAAECFRRMFSDGQIDQWGTLATSTRAHFAKLLVLTGNVDEARTLLLPPGAPFLHAETSHAKAAVAMAQGRRQEARSLLADTLAAIKPGQEGLISVLLDLGWLLMEDDEEFDAELMLDRVVLMESDLPELQWLALALSDRRQPVEASEWEALRAKTPSLIRNCPWLGTPEDVQNRREGRAAPLPNLLTLLAW